MYKEVFTERRLYNRFPCSMVGSYSAGEFTSGNLVCKDVSTGGVGFIVPDPLPLNTKLKLQLFTRDGNAMAINGAVRWCRKQIEGWKAGIRFKNPLFIPLDKVV